MGVKVERVLNQRKGNAVITAVASGAVTSPAAQSIAIVTVLAGDDVNRLVEIETALFDCMEYARENNQYRGNGTTSFITTLNTGKRGVRVEAIASNIVTGELGIMISGNLRSEGKTMILEVAYRQLIEHAREQGRLGE